MLPQEESNSSKGPDIIPDIQASNHPSVSQSQLSNCQNSERNFSHRDFKSKEQNSIGAPRDCNFAFKEGNSSYADNHSSWRDADGTIFSIPQERRKLREGRVRVVLKYFAVYLTLEIAVKVAIFFMDGSEQIKPLIMGHILLNISMTLLVLGLNVLAKRCSGESLKERNKTVEFIIFVVFACFAFGSVYLDKASPKVAQLEALITLLIYPLIRTESKIYSRILELVVCAAILGDNIAGDESISSTFRTAFILTSLLLLSWNLRKPHAEQCDCVLRKDSQHEDDARIKEMKVYCTKCYRPYAWVNENIHFVQEQLSTLAQQNHHLSILATQEEQGYCVIDLKSQKVVLSNAAMLSRSNAIDHVTLFRLISDLRVSLLSSSQSQQENALFTQLKVNGLSPPISTNTNILNNMKQNSIFMPSSQQLRNLPDQQQRHRYGSVEINNYQERRGDCPLENVNPLEKQKIPSKLETKNDISVNEIVSQTEGGIVKNQTDICNYLPETEKILFVPKGEEERGFICEGERPEGGAPPLSGNDSYSFNYNGYAPSPLIKWRMDGSNSPEKKRKSGEAQHQCEMDSMRMSGTSLQTMRKQIGDLQQPVSRPTELTQSMLTKLKRKNNYAHLNSKGNGEDADFLKRLQIIQQDLESHKFFSNSKYRDSINPSKNSSPNPQQFAFSQTESILNLQDEVNLLRRGIHVNALLNQKNRATSYSEVRKRVFTENIASIIPGEGENRHPSFFQRNTAASKHLVMENFLKYPIIECDQKYSFTLLDNFGEFSSLNLLKSDAGFLYLIFEEKQKNKPLESELLNELKNFQTKVLKSISHEFGTPLNCAVNMLKLCSIKVEPEINESFVIPALSSIRILKFSCSDFIDYSNIQIDTFKLDLRPTDIKHLLSKAVSYFNPLVQLQHKQGEELVLSLIVDDNVPTDILSDQHRIMQVIFNLLTNALKFTKKGYIQIKVKKQSEEDIAICVHDSGMGIRPDVQENLFERKTIRNGRQETSGLGLIISNSIAKRLSSRGTGLQVSSKFGEGSIFSFLLNAQAQQIMVQDTKMRKKSHQSSKPSNSLNNSSVSETSFTHFNLFNNANIHIYSNQPPQTINQNNQNQISNANTYNSNNALFLNPSVNNITHFPHLTAVNYPIQSIPHHPQKKHGVPVSMHIQTCPNMSRQQLKEIQGPSSQYSIDIDEVQQMSEGGAELQQNISFLSSLQATPQPNQPASRFDASNFNPLEFDEQVSNISSNNLKDDAIQNNDDSQMKKQSPPRIDSKFVIQTLSPKLISSLRKKSKTSQNSKKEELQPSSEQFPSSYSLSLLPFQKSYAEVKDIEELPQTQQQLILSNGQLSDLNTYNTPEFHCQCESKQHASSLVCSGIMNMKPSSKKPQHSSSDTSHRKQLAFQSIIKIPSHHSPSQFYIQDTLIPPTSTRLQLQPNNLDSKAIETLQESNENVQTNKSRKKLNSNTPKIEISSQNIPSGNYASYLFSNGNIQNEFLFDTSLVDCILQSESNDSIDQASLQFLDEKKNNALGDHFNLVNKNQSLLKISSQNGDPIKCDSSSMFSQKTKSHILDPQKCSQIVLLPTTNDLSSQTQSSYKYSLHPLAGQMAFKMGSHLPRSTEEITSPMRRKCFSVQFEQLSIAPNPLKIIHQEEDKSHQFKQDMLNQASQSNIQEYSPERLRSKTELGVKSSSQLIKDALKRKTCNCPDILIVDDTQMNRHMLKLIISTKFAFSIEEATNGQEAVEKVQNMIDSSCHCKIYKIIFMDIDMPILNGYEATTQINSILQQHNLTCPIIAHTAFNRSLCQEQMDYCNMADYIAKPVSPASVEELLALYIDVSTIFVDKI